MKNKKIVLGVLAVAILAAAGYMFVRDSAPKADVGASKSLQDLDKQYPDEPKTEAPAPSDPANVPGRPAKR
jgi:hypothetical protein